MPLTSCLHLFQWTQWQTSCSLRAGPRCFHVSPTWSGTSGWTVSFQPPTRSPGPTVSTGRTAGWWAAPTPMLLSTCRRRTAGGATSAWSLPPCAASPGPLWLMRGLSPTPAGSTRATAGRRTAWPSITVSAARLRFSLWSETTSEVVFPLLLQGFFQSALRSAWCSNQRPGFCHWWCHFLWPWVSWVHELSLWLGNNSVDLSYMICDWCRRFYFLWFLFWGRE